MVSRMGTFHCIQLAFLTARWAFCPTADERRRRMFDWCTNCPSFRNAFHPSWKLMNFMRKSGTKSKQNFLPNMIWFQDFVETCRNRCYDNNTEHHKIPPVGVTRNLLSWRFNRRFFIFGRRHLLVIALKSFMGKQKKFVNNVTLQNWTIILIYC